MEGERSDRWSSAKIFSELSADQVQDVNKPVTIESRELYSSLLQPTSAVLSPPPPLPSPSALRGLSSICSASALHYRACGRPRVQSPAPPFFVSLLACLLFANIDRPRVQLFCPLPQALWSPAASTKQCNPVPAEHMELYPIPAALWQREVAQTVPHRAAVRGSALCAYLFPLLVLRVTALCYASLSQATGFSLSTFLQQAHSLGSPFLPLSLGAAPPCLSHLASNARLPKCYSLIDL